MLRREIRNYPLHIFCPLKWAFEMCKGVKIAFRMPLKVCFNPCILVRETIFSTVNNFIDIHKKTYL